MRALHGARTLELGCGVGLPSLAAALAGGRVLATDWAPDAVAMTARNAARNGLAVETLCVSWTEPQPLLERAPWDLVLASDVLYEARNGEALLPLLARLIDGRGEIWLADPGRAAAGAFLERAAERFAIETRPAAEIPQGGVYTPARPMSTQREKAEELRRLHAAPEPLVLVNAWDAASARVVAAAPGCRAIATASWSVAAAHGFPDGEAISREAMLAAVARRRERGRASGDRRPRARLRRRERDGGGRDRGRRRRAATSRTRPAPAGCGRRRSTPRSWRRRAPRASSPASRS